MAIWLKLKNWVVASAAGISALIGIYLYGRRQGSLREAQKAAQRDRKQAKRVEHAADKARTIDGDPVERLRKHNRIRD
jgi:hypothetical protein